MRIDYAPFSGHKLYAPKGIGMLYVRDGAPFTPLMVGGGQEAGARSGTENMSGIAALGAVLDALDDGRTFRPHAELCSFRDRLAESLCAALPELRFNTPFDKSLPTTLNFSVPGLASQELLNLFDAAGLRVSAGSACSSGLGAPSHVLEAMRLPVWRSGAGVRLSFGPLIDAATVAAACRAIDHCGEALRRGGRLASRARPAARDGVMAWEHQEACGWLLTDAASGRCIAIDPPASLVQRIVEHVLAHDLTVLAVLNTGSGLDGSEARRQMVSMLGARLAPSAGADAPDLLPLGHQTLERVETRPGHSAYLLGAPAHGRLAADEVAFAFIGQMSAADCVGDRLHAGTVLCQGRRTADLPIGVSREEQPAALPEPALVDPIGLDAFLGRHPVAIVVDVREASEHAASNGLVLGGRAAISVPLANLAHHAHAWLRDGGPALLFVCRSGPRSERAAACLRRLGHRRAWYLAGGLTHAVAATAAMTAES
jgi:rhodanese-related sulfurtransferase